MSEKIKIKFKRCSNDDWWYKDKVGDTFELADGIEFDESYSPDKYALRGEILNKFILKSDVEIIKPKTVV